MIIEQCNFKIFIFSFKSKTKI